MGRPPVYIFKMEIQKMYPGNKDIGSVLALV